MTPEEVPILPAPVNSREGFGRLLNKRGLLNVAIEIGTDKAAFARSLMRQWRGKLLICIDPWADAPADYRDVLANRPRLADFLIAMNVLSEFSGRVQVLQMTSDAARSHPQVADHAGRVSFVYVDGNHAIEFVRRDIAGYWPLMAPDGILAGHDWDAPEVRRAVCEFAAEKNLTVYTMAGDAWSWYVEKP